MIKIFRLDSMEYTPFGDHPWEDEFRSKCGIQFTDSPRESDLFVTRRYPSIAKRTKMRLGIYPNRPILLYTHEPRFDTHSCSKMGEQFGPTVHIMNVYTGDIYLSNFSVYGPQHRHGLLPLIDWLDGPNLTERRTAFIATYIEDPVQSTLIMNGRDINLTGLRQTLALEGHRRGSVDIYGRGWSAGISIQESRGEGWQDEKFRILQNYDFNLCLENTNVDYYCTEKIWDSIRAGSLPIYYGRGNKIYETFPEESFIDLADFAQPESVYDFIQTMPEKEYIARMNRCIQVYNQWCDPVAIKVEREKRTAKLIERIRAIVGLADSSAQRGQSYEAGVGMQR